MHRLRQGMRVLFGTSSWGLGHATRDLALIRALLEEGCEVTVVSDGNALQLLRQELGEAVEFLDWPDIPTTIASSTWRYYAKTVGNLPQILATWRAEKRQFNELLQQRSFDVIVSDHRFGLVTSEIPSYFITNSLRYIAPWRDPLIEVSMEGVMARWLKLARGVFIPDDEDSALTGDMNHNLRFFPREKRIYMGLLSSIRHRPDLPEDIDVFMTISGPEPQRTMLQEKVLQQLPVLEGRRVVITLGQPGQDPLPAPKGVEVYNYLNRERQEEMLNRSKLVVCRSGYSTITELSLLGKRALLIPTPGQTEQLYLGQTLHERGLFHSVDQRHLDLSRDLPRAMERPGYRPDHDADESVRIFLDTIGQDVDAMTNSF